VSDVSDVGQRRAAAKPGRHKEETIVKRVSHRQHDDDHGGTWKVAFADFCLALMCLFLVLWVLSTKESQMANGKFSTSHGSVLSSGSGSLHDGNGSPQGPLVVLESRPLAGRDQSAARNARDTADDPGDAEPAEPADRALPDESEAELRAVAARLERLGIEAKLLGNLRMMMTPAGLRVMLHDTDNQGLFELGSAVPDRRFDALLQRIGTLLARIGNPVLIVGHTDAVPYLPQPGQTVHARSNWHLSSERAMAARASLLQGGLPGNKVLQVIGMAERAPLNADDPRAAVNRRIELLILTERRARMIEQMFGMPRTVVPLIDGVDAVWSAPAPDSEALQDQVTREISSRPFN
jgi:chemotaxis protein MotB